MNSPIDGAWELISGQPLPEGARDIKILSGGHFIFTAYESDGKPLYTAGGTYELKGTSYKERMDFASDPIAELVGKEQSFAVNVDGDTLTQTGILSNGKPLSEKFKRLG